MARAPQQTGGQPTLADLAQVAPAGRPHRMQGEERKRRPPSRLRRWFVTLLVLGIVVGGGALGIAGWFLDDQGRSPREWAPYIERRASGNHPVIVEAGTLLARILRRMDILRRGEDVPIPPPAPGPPSAMSCATA